MGEQMTGVLIVSYDMSAHCEMGYGITPRGRGLQWGRASGARFTLEACVMERARLGARVV